MAFVKNRAKDKVRFLKSHDSSSSERSPPYTPRAEAIAQTSAEPAFSNDLFLVDELNLMQKINFLLQMHPHEHYRHGLKPAAHSEPKLRLVCL